MVQLKCRNASLYAKRCNSSVSKMTPSQSNSNAYSKIVSCAAVVEGEGDSSDENVAAIRNAGDSRGRTGSIAAVCEEIE